MIFDFFMIKTRIPVNGKETRFFLDKDLWTPPLGVKNVNILKNQGTLTDPLEPF